jgi:hypothetical protein
MQRRLRVANQSGDRGCSTLRAYWKGGAILGGHPKDFGLDAEQDHRPCPFKGEAYQWMRNVVLADRLASARGVSAAVIAAYADANGFATAKKVRSGLLGPAAASGTTLIIPTAYQSIVALTQSLSEHPSEWNAIATWVERKIRTVAARSRTTAPTNRIPS